MNKFYVTIPKPCHENWEQMTKEDKGRFCGSCQKTVIDFTAMSDRELVAFFKKPAASVCGRFQKDQLNREITIPKKRIPWLKYFFTVTWPAFMLFLKSCNTKERLTGDVVSISAEVNKNAGTDKYEYTTVGMLIAPEILPVDTVSEPTQLQGDILIDEELMGKPMAAIKEPPVQNEVMGQFAEGLTLDTAIIDTTLQEPTYKQLDTVVVMAPERIECTKVMGGLSLVTVTTIYLDAQAASAQEKPLFATYPNPVKAGSLLTIQWSNGKATPVSVHLWNAAGQQLAVRKLNEGIGNSVKLIIPYNLSTGIYFVQAIYKNGDVAKTSIMVHR